MKSLIQLGILLILGLTLAIAPLTYSFPAPTTSPKTHAIVIPERITEIEQDWLNDYQDYLDNQASIPIASMDRINATLHRLNSETATNMALIYVFPDTYQLELIVVIPGSPLIRKVLPEVSQATLLGVINDFRGLITRLSGGRQFLRSSQQLYQWIIAPVEADLQSHHIDTLVFCVGDDLRSTPLAALHDGEQFLIEKYSMAMIPAFSLTNLTHHPINNARILAMGASQFQELSTLPAVPMELTAITQNQQDGQIFLNQDFTLSNLRRLLRSQAFNIVHLATHAEFRAGSPQNSYIQLWQNDRLELNHLRRLDWDDLPVELLVLSACQTALGDRQAELGFAGLSFQAGVKSSLASLWRVSDLGTLALMQEFYRQLARPEVTTKAEALRQTQIALLQKQIYIAGSTLHSPGGILPIPDDLGHDITLDFASPYYWAAFTLIGSPW